MKTITPILTEIVSDAFRQCGYEPSLGIVTSSDRLDLCQFQCNGAFGGAKLYKKPPFVIAGEVAEKLREQPIFSKAEAFKPGFINLNLSDAYLLEAIRAVETDACLGIPQAEQPETIVIDYGGPNAAKPLHIGHLRPAIIGEALKRLARSLGHRVIGDVHLGDWGLPMGLVIGELKLRHPQWRCFASDFSPEKDPIPSLDTASLNEIYPLASKKSKEDPDFKALAHQITAELQNGHSGYTALWKKILPLSVEDMKKSYAQLNVEFDLWYGESDSARYVNQLVDTLTQKGLLYNSEGALVVDVSLPEDKAPMPPIIVKKSDGSSIYATTDLATIIQRQQDFSPNRIWYVVDKRQGLHFTQVFRCAKKAGLVSQETELFFLGNGTMNGSDGKPFKTRDGDVMPLSELLGTVSASAAEKLKSSGFVAEDSQAETAQKVGIAAIKFGDLINHPTKDYIFDLDKFLSFEGKTGTYLLYMVTRMNSILKTAAENGLVPGFHGVYTQSERELLLKLLLTGEAFLYAFSEKSPSYICENAYQIAALFSRFYHDNHILSEEDAEKKASWLALVALTKRVLEKHLEVLAIQPVEHM